MYLFKWYGVINCSVVITGYDSVKKHAGELILHRALLKWVENEQCIKDGEHSKDVFYSQKIIYDNESYLFIM